ncbi:MAG: ATP-binding protein [Desulfobacterales bacterium]|nr:ATP-binding protein [Desulfobacterales bacterium]
MYRSALDYLTGWKQRKKRKPLVIRGARQVGKSYLVSMFAQKNFPGFIEINFEKNPEMKTLFNGTPEKVIQLLEIKFKKRIDIRDSLLFLDEIQAAPEVFAKLRYFYEDIPDLHVIAAGSLLEFLLENHTFSMPVGRIEYLHLGPMTFTEFLLANGNTMLADFLQNFSPAESVHEAIHSDLISLFKSYLIVGGMPEAVAAFADTKSFHEAEIVKASVLGTYEDDFNKYSSKVSHRLILNIFKKLPLMIGEKFKYVNIDRNERSKNIAEALHLLEMAKITFLVKHSACNGIPLGAEVNHRKFKTLFLDVGLMASACGLTMLDIENSDNVMMVNSGRLCEQFVGQHLLFSGEFYRKPELYYWVREAKSSSAEVDYVISAGSRIIPVEVKAGKTGRLKSLHQFVKEKHADLSVRINLEQPSVFHETDKVAGRQKPRHTLLSIPFYLVEQIRRLTGRVV